MRRTMASIVGVLATVGVAASAAYYLKEPYNPGFLEFPVVIGIHVVFGGIYLALAPFQFVVRIRSRFAAYHRWSGRLLVGIGLIAGVTALITAELFPFSGWPERVIVGFFACFFLFALVKSFVHVRNRQFAEHRVWMIRAFAIALSIATMRLIFISALMFLGEPTAQLAATLSIVSFSIAFVLHSALAELWIATTGAPRTRPALGRGVEAST